jgi:rod shape determining protein RodA
VPVDRRLLINIDWMLVGACLVLSAIGVATILSATHAGRGLGLEVKQIYWILIGVVALLISVTLDYRRLTDRALFLYVFIVAALIYVLVLGPRIQGTRRWILLGPVQFQPSEFAKLVAALLLAKVFAESKKETLGVREIVGPGLTIAVLVLLIAAEPDLGTAFCMLPPFLAVAFLGGLRPKAIAIIGGVLILFGGLGWQFALKDYQKNRIYTFLDPALDPRGAGYQKIQSQIAVGSGGLSGKGYKNGSQSQLGYLPARHTDFIFSVLAEEMGFLGVTTVLGLYLLVLWRSLETARAARDRVGAFLAAAITAGLAFQVVYNVAMVAGLVPVKGLPLPFMSYGGSSVIYSFLAVGLILNVRMRRFAN